MEGSGKKKKEIIAKKIGKTGYPLNKIISEIQNVGFKIKKIYRVFRHPYHKFFILKK